MVCELLLHASELGTHHSTDWTPARSLQHRVPAGKLSTAPPSGETQPSMVFELLPRASEIGAHHGINCTPCSLQRRVLGTLRVVPPSSGTQPTMVCELLPRAVESNRHHSMASGRYGACSSECIAPNAAKQRDTAFDRCVSCSRVRPRLARTPAWARRRAACSIEYIAHGVAKQRYKAYDGV